MWKRFYKYKTEDSSDIQEPLTTLQFFISPLAINFLHPLHQFSTPPSLCRPQTSPRTLLVTSRNLAWGSLIQKKQQQAWKPTDIIPPCQSKCWAHRSVRTGRDLWRPSSPTSLPKQDHLEQVISPKGAFIKKPRNMYTGLSLDIKTKTQHEVQKALVHNKCPAKHHILPQSTSSQAGSCWLLSLCQARGANHRIMEWLRLAGTLKIIQFQLPAMGTDTFH